LLYPTNVRFVGVKNDPLRDAIQQVLLLECRFEAVAFYSDVEEAYTVQSWLDRLHPTAFTGILPGRRRTPAGPNAHPLTNLDRHILPINQSSS
jgi:hypothetical protein